MNKEYLKLTLMDAHVRVTENVNFMRESLVLGRL